MLARGSFLIRKALKQPVAAIAKDPGQIRRHQPPVDQPASPDRVAHLILDQRAALHPAEAVLVLSPAAARRSELVKALEVFDGIIDDGTMRAANKRGDVDGESPAQAARFLLKAVGLSSPANKAGAGADSS